MPGKKEKQPLSVTHPELAKEADGWDPSHFTAGSNKKNSWECSKGHTWSSSIQSRTSGTGCPICSNQKVLFGFNDLQTTHPDLAEQANGWDPKTKIAGSNKKVSWKCLKGHIWESVLASRALHGNGCPFCSGLKVWPGFNDLATTHPEIAVDAVGWDPATVSFGVTKPFLWKCEYGHTYTARIDHRARGVSNCHFCSGHKVLEGFNDLETVSPILAQQAYGWDPTKFTTGSSYRKKWICGEGHIWTAAIVDRKINGCPTCSPTGFNPNSDGYFYLIEHPRWEMFQVGITNSPDNRLKDHKILGWELLELRGPMDGHLTQQWETAILRMLKAKGADLSNSKIAGKFDGYSEAWSKSTFEVKSIKELMKLTEEFEEK